MRQFRIPALVAVLLCASCAVAPMHLGKSPQEPVAVAEMKNFAGVPLRVPAIYFGDALGAAEELEIEKLDLLQLSRAALLGELRARGYAAQLAESATGARHEVHAAIVHFDLGALKSEGRVTLAMLIIVVDARAGKELARGEARRTFQLLSRAPGEGGALGEARFIEQRLKAFVEALAIEALDLLKL